MLKLVTSNKFKLREFQRFGLDIDIASGIDLDEVLGTAEEVIIYKAIAAGANLMVEDTILIVDNVEIVDIREKINDLHDLINKKATWKVSIACVIEDEVHFATSEITGFIGLPTHDLSLSFGFDPFFNVYIEDSKLSFSLSQLEDVKQKDNFSARKNCIQDFVNKKNSFKKIKLNTIPKWTGKYQSISH